MNVFILVNQTSIQIYNISLIETEKNCSYQKLGERIEKMLVKGHKISVKTRTATSRDLLYIIVTAVNNGMLNA